MKSVTNVTRSHVPLFLTRTHLLKKQNQKNALCGNLFLTLLIGVFLVCCLLRKLSKRYERRSGGVSGEKGEMAGIFPFVFSCLCRRKIEMENFLYSCQYTIKKSWD